ncbi:MAG: alpha/beta fold hydrolase [Allosphingosinicella sp.]
MEQAGDRAGAAPPFQDRRWRSRDGLALHARDYPAADGPVRLPVICLHGLTRNAKDFEDVAPLLAAQGRRVLVPDIRGRGLSERDPEPARYMPKTYARDVLELMDGLGIARAVFLGTSMGGIITMALAALRPGAIAAAILNDVGPEIAPAGVARIMSYAGKKADVASWEEAADHLRGINAAVFRNYQDEDWQRFARRTFRDIGGKPELDYDPAIMVPLAQGRYKAANLLAWLLFLRLARSRPVLLVRGALSDLLAPATVARMRRRAPRLRVVEVPDVGHAPMLTEPDATRAIDEFLAAVD